jgi:hypothetical protein
MNRLRRLLAVSLIVSITGLGLPLSAQAGMLATSDALNANSRARINSLLERQDVQAKLAAYGVNMSEVKARVAALSDQEAAQLASQIDKAPAGGDGGALIGAALIVFLVLLLTDILGYTHIFPFSKKLTQ